VDVKIMLALFRDFVAKRDSPGIIVVPSSRSIGEGIEKRNANLARGGYTPTPVISNAIPT